MFPMTVTLHNQAQLNAVLAAMNLDAELPKPAAARVEAKPEKKQDAAGAAQTAEAPQTTTTVTAESPKTESVAAEVGKSAAQATQALDGHAVQEESAPTYQDASKAITDLAKAKGRTAAIEVFKAFGIEKLPDAKPEQFAAIIEAAKKAGA